MRILYVGKNEHGAYPAEEFAKSKEWTFIRFNFSENDIEEPINFKEIENEILAYSFEKIIFDLSNIENSEEEVVEVVNNIKLAKSCEVIIFAPRFNIKSRLIMSLQSFEIEYFVFGEKNQGQIREEMTAALNGEIFHEKIDPETIISNREEIAEKAGIITDENYSGNDGNVKKIAVVGGLRHIGCTTVALQLVKHINLRNENSACYIETSGTMIKSLQEFFSKSLKEFNGGYIFKDIVMFDKSIPSPTVISKGFKFLVYDYGHIATVDRTILLDRDIIVAVSGTNPDELQPFKADVLPVLYDNNVSNYIFNFTPEADRKGILSLMNKAKDKTFFMEYTPDPFIYCPEHKDSFDKILSTIIPPDKAALKYTKRKRRLFHR